MSIPSLGSLLKFALKEVDRERLFQDLLEANIPYSIELGVSLQSCEEVLQLCAEHPGRIFPALESADPYSSWRNGQRTCGEQSRNRILVETDALFILPYCKDVIQPKFLRRPGIPHCSPPAVIKKIAEATSRHPTYLYRQDELATRS